MAEIAGAVYSDPHDRNDYMGARLYSERKEAYGHGRVRRIFQVLYKSRNCNYVLK